MWRDGALRWSPTDWPSAPVLFCETRKLAQEWTYRFLAAAATATELDDGGRDAVADLAVPPALPPAPPTAAEIRVWALAHGYQLSSKGRIPAPIAEAYAQAHA